MKARLARVAHRAESTLDRFRARTGVDHGHDGVPVIDPYLGYSTPDGVVLRGRVLSNLLCSDPREDQRWWQNLRQMARLFATDEVADVEVRAQGSAARTDEEGYFTLRVPDRDLPPAEAGWIQVPARLPAFDHCTVLHAQITPGNAEFGVISDIDDTMIRTGAYSLAKNLWTSMTGNAATREVFEDAVALMAMLSAGGRNPVFFVSSSPWNLHGFLLDLFGRAGLARGPMFLRDLGVDADKFITGTHGDHKGAAIDAILAANPDLNFTLIGDTGQHDAHVYRDAHRRHPGRILRVILREPRRGADAQDMGHVAQMRAEGLEVYVGANYRPLVQAGADGDAAPRTESV